jgi:hypothetical protein
VRGFYSLPSPTSGKEKMPKRFSYLFKETKDSTIENRSVNKSDKVDIRDFLRSSSRGDYNKQLDRLKDVKKLLNETGEWLKKNKNHFHKIGLAEDKLIEFIDDTEAIGEDGFISDRDAMNGFFTRVNTILDAKDRLELRSINIERFIKEKNLNEGAKKVFKRASESFQYLTQKARYVESINFSFLELTSIYSSLVLDTDRASGEDALRNYNHRSKPILRAEKALRDELNEPLDHTLNQ